MPIEAWFPTIIFYEDVQVPDKVSGQAMEAVRQVSERFRDTTVLIDPERTASGYRKFYDDDVELLRCILREQKENYLPLRVIKDRLDSGEIDPTGEQPRPRGIKNVADPDEAPSTPNDGVPTGAEALFMRTDGPPVATGAPSTPATPAAPPATRHAGPEASAVRSEPRHAEQAEQRPPAAATESHTPTPDPAPAVLPGVLLTADELCAGLLPMEGTGGSVFGEEAVEIAIICKRFLDIGVDTRHLRGWRVAADREAGLIEQLIQPLMRQRNPEARTVAIERMVTLEDLGGQLRAAMMRSALTPHRSR